MESPVGEFSLSHILILSAVLIVFFGPSRLPGLAKAMGEGIRDFKKSLNGEDDQPQKKPEIEKTKAE